MATPRDRHARASAPRGYISSLTPEGQVHKVITDIKNLKDGDNLHNWSASSRKELTSAITIPFQVGTDTKSLVHVPKLALIVASPVVRAYFTVKPDATTAKFVHVDIFTKAMKQIATWLKGVSNDAQMPELGMPENIKEALELRLTAYTLGMERYVKHFEAYYAINVGYYDPNAQEISDVVDYTRGDGDAMLGALANRLSYLCRYHKVPEAVEMAYAELLVDQKFGRLLAAVKENEVRAMVEHFRRDEDAAAKIW